MRLIDHSLETIASTLIASGLSLDLIENLDSTDDLIHDLLGEERVDQIINVYSLGGKILAQNYTGMEIPLKFSGSERWQTYIVGKRTVHVLNIQSGQLLLQVGMILNPSISRWNFLNSHFAVLSVIIFILLIITAYFSSGILFAPIKLLTRDLQSMSKQLDRKLGQALSEFVIGPELTSLFSANNKTSDEFELLCIEIKSFLNKLEDYTKSFNAQTAILTHELKTPLTILRNYLEELKSKAVDSISFEVKDGEIVGLLGENGAGKTTTLRMLATMLKATGGTATVNGFDINKEPDKVRGQIGILFGGEVGLYDRLTARENMKYFAELNGLPKEKIDERTKYLSEMLGMEAYMDKRVGKF